MFWWPSPSGSSSVYSVPKSASACSVESPTSVAQHSTFRLRSFSPAAFCSVPVLKAVGVKSYSSSIIATISSRSSTAGDSGSSTCSLLTRSSSAFSGSLRGV